MKTRLRRLALGVCLAATLPPAQAELAINTTRVVFESNKRNASVVIANPSTRPFAVQTWVNTAKDDTETPVPLATSPGLFKLAPGKEQMVQISRLPNDLPSDRETLFYLNVQEIPEVDPEAKNALYFALRTRLKVFYRPSELKGLPAEYIHHLKWSVRKAAGGIQLVVDNPTPYHYTFSRMEVKDASTTEPIAARAMAPPFGQQVYELERIKSATGLQLSFTTINDYGVPTPVVNTPLPNAN
ncbi:molecular chaperone [Pseudomonas putida]|uniref:fimbrial biogenesis chaperone n=1 Tax=Pseudomonas putida TaxID=303 RepID=UPI0034D54718